MKDFPDERTFCKQLAPPFMVYGVNYSADDVTRLTITTAIIFL